MIDTSPDAEQFTALALSAYRSEAVGAELFGCLGGTFAAHREELAEAQRIEQAMMCLLRRLLEGKSVAIGASLVAEARAEAHRYLARFAESSWPRFVDDILMWSAQALHEFSSLLHSVGDDVHQREDIRTFLAHEAELVVWARHAAAGEDDRALARLREFAATLAVPQA